MLIKHISENNMLDFRGNCLAIEYNPNYSNHEYITINSPFHFKTISHHLLIEELYCPIKMQEPIFEVDDGSEPFIIHDIRIISNKINTFMQYSDSPEIFFHVNDSIVTDVTVTIPEGVTLTNFPSRLAS